MFYFPQDQSWYCGYLNSALAIDAQHDHVFNALFITGSLASTAVIVITLRVFKKIWTTGLNLTFYVHEFVTRSINYPIVKTPGFFRTSFNETTIVPIRPQKNHTHGNSAAIRSTGSRFIKNFSAAVGMEPYYFQMSNTDVNKGKSGNRAYFFSKDTPVPDSDLQLTDSHILAMVDVDQYLDMPNIMISCFKPIVLYTFQPGRTSRCAEDYSYTFLEKSVVEYSVNGGGRYTHPVWNYGSDHITVVQKFFGIPYRFATFLVERRQLDLDHQLILLVPVKKWCI